MLDPLLRPEVTEVVARDSGRELSLAAISVASMLALGLLMSLGTIVLGNHVTALLLQQNR